MCEAVDSRLIRVSYGVEDVSYMKANVLLGLLRDAHRQEGAILYIRERKQT